MDFQAFDSLARLGDVAYLAPGAALAVGGLVSSFWPIQRLRLDAKPTASPPPLPVQPPPPPQLDDLPPPLSGTTIRPFIKPKRTQIDDQRRNARRGGNPTAVRVNDAVDGRVLNRSRGGLCVESAEPFAVGQIISVRPTEFDPTALPVDVEIRHARKRDDVWIHGCKFVAAPPWSVLLQFG